MANPSHPENLGICPQHFLEMKRTPTGWECPIDGTSWLLPARGRLQPLYELARRWRIGFGVMNPAFVPFKVTLGASILMIGMLTSTLNLARGFNLGVSIAGVDPVSAAFLFGGTVLLLDGLVRMLFGRNLT